MFGVIIQVIKMEQNKLIAIVAVVAVVIIAAAAVVIMNNNNDNGSKDDPVDPTDTIVDFAGRTVAIPDNLDNGIVTVGKLSVVRMLSYFPEVFDKIKMVDYDIQKNLDNGGQYFAFVDSMKEVITNAQTHNTDSLSDEDKEKIGTLNPSIIIVNNSTYSSNKDSCDLLAKSFTLIVVDDMGHFDYTKYWNDDLVLDKDFTDCFTLYGKFLKQEDRAKEIVDGMNAVMKDIKSMMTGTPTGKYYVTGVSYMGLNDMLNMFPNCLPLMMVNGANAYGAKYDGIRVTLPDADELTKYEFTNVILDPSATPRFGPDNENSQAFLKYVFTKNAEESTDITINVIFPLVAFGTNWEAVLMNAYYLADLCYGKEMTTKELEDKAVSAMKVFFGDNAMKIVKGLENSNKQKGQKAAGGQDIIILGEETVIEVDGKYFMREI